VITVIQSNSMRNVSVKEWYEDYQGRCALEMRSGNIESKK